MAEIKEKHPSWFKMKIERRELIRQLSPETAVNVLLACWDFLETGEKPSGLSPIESVAFSAFIPDMDEAWSKYIKRISNGAQGGRPKGGKPYGSVCPQTVPNGTEEESDSLLLRNKDREGGADKPPRRPRFFPPTVEQVAEYVRQRGSSVDPQGFIDFYASKGWMVGRTPMRDWKAACRNAESWEKWKKPTSGRKEDPYGPYF